MTHVHQLPSGRWRAIVQAGGIRRSVTADTKRQAERAGARVLLELGAAPTYRATVADIIGRWLALKEKDWSRTYLADVDAVIELLPESFTDELAAAVKITDIENLYHKLGHSGWSTHRLRRLHEVLSAAWTRAERRQLVPHNPLKDIAKPEARHRELHIPTHADVDAILRAADSTSEHLALWIAATLGIRRGEVVALQWRDIDTDRAEITIRRSLSYAPDPDTYEVSADDETGPLPSGVVIGETKTGLAGHRVLAIDADTCRLLTAWREQQSERPRTASHEQRWVFSDDGGVTPWRPDRLTHIFAAARKAAKVNGVRLHDLRHYVATSMLQDGEPLIDVAAQLGHTSPATTSSVYTHYMPGRGRASVERRAARLRTD